MLTSTLHAALLLLVKIRESCHKVGFEALVNLVSPPDGFLSHFSLGNAFFHFN